MIDESKLEALKQKQNSQQRGDESKTRVEQPNPKSVRNQMSYMSEEQIRSQLSALSEKELRKIQAVLEEMLPEQYVKELNLEDELLQQYRKTKRLMDDALDDDDVPSNQKAQVANSVVSTLGQLVKLQEDLKLQEALKLMENTLIEVIKTLPQATKDQFFEEYEMQAKKVGLA